MHGNQATGLFHVCCGREEIGAALLGRNRIRKASLELYVRDGMKVSHLFDFDVEAGPHWSTRADGKSTKCVKGRVRLLEMTDDERQIVLHRLRACAVDIYETLSGQQAPGEMSYPASGDEPETIE